MVENNAVYFLQHERHIDDEEEVKTIGVYSCKRQADLAIDRNTNPIFKNTVQIKKEDMPLFQDYRKRKLVLDVAFLFLILFLMTMNAFHFTASEFSS